MLIIDQARLSKFILSNPRLFSKYHAITNRSTIGTYNAGWRKTEKKLFLVVWHRFANSNGCKKSNGQLHALDRLNSSMYFSLWWVCQMPILVQQLPILWYCCQSNMYQEVESTDAKKKFWFHFFFKSDYNYQDFRQTPFAKLKAMIR